MQIGIITSIQYLEKYASLSHFHLILAHLIKESKEYKEFYLKMKQRGDFIMLDNSTFELGYAMKAEELVEIANEMRVNEVIAPEVPNNKEETLNLVKSFSFCEKALPPMCKIAAVVHGKTYAERFECFLDYNKDDFNFVKTICIPSVISELLDAPIYQPTDSTTRNVINRIYFIKHLFNFINGYYKPIHLNWLFLCDSVL